MLWLLLLIVVVGAVYWIFMSPWSQLWGRFPYSAKTTEKKIALTFDDGPNEPYTSELLRILNKESVLGTFFVVGECAKRHPKMTAKILKDGHVLGNHSLRHKFSTYMKPGAFIKEVESTQNIIFEQTGKKPAMYRTPWLWRNPLLLRSVNKLGLHPVGGEFCHSLEVFNASANAIAEGALSKIKPGAIIIFHDGKEGTGGDRKNTVAAVKILIPRLKQLGYKFETVDKMLGIKAYQ